MTSLLIADDHPVVLKGIADHLLEQKQFTIVAQCTNGKEAFDSIIDTKPKVALIDIDMPLMSGIEVTERINGLKLETKIIILTMHRERSVYLEAIDAGAKGYLLKDFLLDEIVDCINFVAEGEDYISKKLTSYLVKDKKIILSEILKNKYDLTKTESDVVHLIAQGKDNKEMTEMLFVSVKTIETHMYNIHKKLGVAGRCAVQRFLMANKLI